MVREAAFDTSGVHSQALRPMPAGPAGWEVTVGSPPLGTQAAGRQRQQPGGAFLWIASRHHDFGTEQSLDQTAGTVDESGAHGLGPPACDLPVLANPLAARQGAVWQSQAASRTKRSFPSFSCSSARIRNIPPWLWRNKPRDPSQDPVRTHTEPLPAASPSRNGPCVRATRRTQAPGRRHLFASAPGRPPPARSWARRSPSGEGSEAPGTTPRQQKEANSRRGDGMIVNHLSLCSTPASRQ